MNASFESLAVTLSQKVLSEKGSSFCEIWVKGGLYGDEINGCGFH